MITAVEQTILDGAPDTEIQIDYMHTKRFIPGSEYYRRMADLYSYEFDSLRFDAVIVVGEDAVGFALAQSDRLFADTPIICSAISMGTAASANQRPHYLAVSADWNMKRNIQLITQLFPRVKRVVFTQDHTSDGLAFAADARALAGQFPKLDFVFLTDLTMPELLARVKHLPSDAVLFSLPFTVDKAGNYFVAVRALSLQAAVSPVPIMGLWQFQMGTIGLRERESIRGVLGGLLINDRQYGTVVAQAVLQILRGADVKAVAVDKDKSAHYMFDYQLMQRFDVPVSALPPGSAIFDRPPSFLQRHREAILVSAVVLLALTGLMIALLAKSASRRRAEGERFDLERQMLERNRHFYRETILSVTGGKLEMSEPSDIEAYIRNAEVTATLVTPADVPTARDAVQAYLDSKGLHGEALYSFMSGVVEAVVNAVKHAEEGCAYAGTADGWVWVAVTDNGPGIDSLTLPQAALRRGFSTKLSMGMGYTIILDTADRVLLSTGKEGTRVILLKRLEKTAPELELDQYPDTWDQV